MKINLSERISDAIFKSSGKSGINRSESLLKAFRAAALVNSFNPKIPKSDRFYLRVAVDYYVRALRASKNNTFMAAYSLCCPVEILYAMDIVPLQIEATGWLLSMLLHETGPLLTAASEAGLASEICSVHRLVTGSFVRQLLPRVNAVLWTNIPCENSAKCGELLAKQNECPGCFVDHPHDRTPESEKYLTAELQNLVTFLVEKSGHKMNFKKLAEAINQSNLQIELTREIAQMRKNVPSTFPSFTFIRVFMTHLLLAGREEGTKYLELLRNELLARLREGKGVLMEERFRLINMNLPPLYFMGSLEEIFREHGAIEVVNPFFLDWPEGTLDPSELLRSLAKKSFMNPMMRICASYSQPMLENLRKDVSEYKIDGAINYAHIGCGSFGGVSSLVRQTMREEGVPMLDLSCDITDPTVVSPEEMRDQMARFFEQLEDK